MGQERNDPITNTLSAQADRVSFPAFAAQMPNVIKTYRKDVGHIEALLAGILIASTCAIFIIAVIVMCS